MFNLYLKNEVRDGKPGVVYYNPDRHKVAFNPWPSRPTKRNKTVMFNGYKWRVVWLDANAESVVS